MFEKMKKYVKIKISLLDSCEFKGELNNRLKATKQR